MCNPETAVSREECISLYLEFLLLSMVSVKAQTTPFIVQYIRPYETAYRAAIKEMKPISI